MAEKVIGRNVMLYVYDEVLEVDVPFACATDAILTNNLELKEITSQSSANFREFKPDIGTWQIQGNGFIILNDQYNYLYQLDAILNRTLLLVKFVIDNGGSLGLSIFSGNAYLINHSISSPDTAASAYSLVLQGTGAPSTSGAVITPGGTTIISGTTVQVFQTTATEGQTAITFAGTVGLSALYASRGGIAVQPLQFSGSPTGNGGTWDIATGVLTLATPAVDGEQFLILAQ
jgi:hypothetical protein